MTRPSGSVSPRRFRPTLGATLAALPAFLVLLGLGTWQLDRLIWKRDLIAWRGAQYAAPVVPLPWVDEAAEAFEFRRVSVTGTFLHEKEMYLVKPSRRGEAGFHVITPLLRSGEPAVLIDRGWVPPDRRDPGRRRAGQVAGEVTVKGIARKGGRRGWFVPANEPESNLWFWPDLPRMAAFARVSLQPVLVEAGPEPNPGGLPLGGQTRVEFRNDHPAYALTWYGLAAALAVVFVLSQRRRA